MPQQTPGPSVVPPSTSLSMTLTDQPLAPWACMMSWSSQTVLSDEFLMTTFFARMTRPQLTDFESMTVLSAVMVQGPP